MSNIGMSMHENPSFYLREDEAENICFYWTNPWSGQPEKIATLSWPCHPVEETEAIEQLFSELRLSRKDHLDGASELANKIELHLKLDETPGYILTNADQQMIVRALRAVCPQ